MELLGDAPFGQERLKRPAFERRWLEFRIGMIAAIEQFTCVLGHWILVATVLSVLWVRGTRQLLAQEPSMQVEARLSFLGVLARIRQSAESTALLPHPKLFRQAIQRYLRRDFHPSQEGSLELALSYLERYQTAA